MAVIGRHMELKRAGRTWKGNCVFHGEKTPSFHVYTDDKHYHCYGCGERGDVFKFLQKLTGRNFVDVVKELAAEVGVEIPEGEAEADPQKAQRRRERNELLAACDAAARYWAARLESRWGDAARGYLAGRGITPEMVKAFRLGVAADAWDDLGPRLEPKGVTRDAIRRAGLTVDKDRRSYDRFRGRLMFPIAGLDGKVIGFGARALGEEKGAKYINTPETPLYKKGRVLYGLDVAREQIRKTRRAVLVEGYFDVIGLHQAGVRNAVAVCGTSLTPEHVELLERCDCREVVMLFDGDAAGAAAPAKNAPALLPTSIAGKVALLPAAAGKIDPDEFARSQGGGAVEALVAAAVPITDFLVDQAVAQVSGGADLRDASLEQKIEAVRYLRPFVTALADGLSRSIFLERISRRLGVVEDRLREVVEPPAQRPTVETAPGGRTPARPAQDPRGRTLRSVEQVRSRVRLANPAVDALAMLAAFPDLLAGAAAEENFALTLPEGALSDLARDLLSVPVPHAQVVERVSHALDSASLLRFRGVLGPACPGRDVAEREFRRAIVRAKLEAVQAEMERTLKLVAKAGRAEEDLVAREQRLMSQRRDLERRLRSLDR